MTTKITFIILLSILVMKFHSQDSLVKLSKSFADNSFSDTTITFCTYQNFNTNSMEFLQGNKSRVTYDSYGNDILSEIFTLNDEPSYRIIKTFNTDNKILESKHRNWDSDIQDWSNDYVRLSTYSYNSNLDLLSEESKNYSSTGEISEYKYDYSYDTNFNRVKRWYSLLEDDGITWNTNLINSYDHDALNNLIFQSDSLFNDWDSSWEEKQYLQEYNTENELIAKQKVMNGQISKTIFTYDNNGNNTLEMNLLWDDNNGYWIYYRHELVSSNSIWQGHTYLATKFEKSYDGNNNLLNETQSNYNDTTNSYDLFREYQYTYNSNDQVLIKTSIFVNANPQDMQFPMYKSYYTYNSNDELVSLLTTAWNPDTSEWFDWNRESYYYDENGNQIYFDHMYPTVVDDEITWIYCCKTEVCEIIMSVKKSFEFSISVAPNPTNNFITIQKLPSESIIEIYDISGKRLLNENTRQSNKELSIKDLGASGFYFLRIYSESKNYSLTKKIILE